VKVITVDWEEIRRYYAPLLSAFGDGIVLSIGAGGTAIFKELAVDRPHVSIGCRRPSSGSILKKTLVTVARRLPEPARNLLRSLEHRFLMSFEPAAREVRMTDEEIVRIKSFPKAVILDDAVDTGATMKSVVDAVRSAGYRGRIITVVYAWTSAESCVKPDFWCRESVLVKFPWSRSL
jgi:phosphoribosylpyrophosphate synthetase